jgi:radical SAM protein with 4Fe4S-binding SPASM domain
LLDTLVIAYDGSMSRCNHIWETEKETNFHEMNIKDIWDSDCLREIRENYPDDDCGSCDQWAGHTCGESWCLVDGEIEHKIYGEINEVNVE